MREEEVYEVLFCIYTRYVLLYVCTAVGTVRYTAAVCIGILFFFLFLFSFFILCGSSCSSCLLWYPVRIHVLICIYAVVTAAVMAAAASFVAAISWFFWVYL